MRPSFLLTKAGRRNSGTDLDALIPRYRDAFVGRFTWEGLPEGVPDDYIEDVLFFNAGISAKKVKGLGPCIMGASPTKYNIYNIPARWLPAGISPTDADGSSLIGSSLFSESDMPVLWQGISVLEKITPFIEIQRKAVNALNQNMAALSMPILLEKSSNCDLNAQILKQNLGSGDIYIQCIDKGAVNASVLDLGAENHAESLISVIHDTDATILDIMHVRSALEKASGISEAESSASEMQLMQGLEKDLRIRREWAERINEKLGLNLTVNITGYQEGEKNAVDSSEGIDAGREGDELGAES